MRRESVHIRHQDSRGQHKDQFICEKLLSNFKFQSGKAGNSSISDP